MALKTPIGLAALICLPILLLLTGLLIWNPQGNFWLTVEPPKAQCEAYDVESLRTHRTLTTDIYDQRKLDRLIREPQNTISNLGYSVVGMAICLAGRKPAAKALGLAGIFLGFGSGIYHATLLPEWRMIDILGVYAVLYCLVLLGTEAVWPVGNRTLRGWVIALLIWAVAIYTGIHRNDLRWQEVKIFDSTYVFVAAVAVGSLLAAIACYKATSRRRCVFFGGIMMGCAIISFAGGLGDRYGGFWAAPDGFFQGHAIWHTFGALAMLAAYEVFSAAGADQSTLKRATQSA